MGGKKISTIAIIYNLKKLPLSPLDDTYEEYDDWATIEALKNEIEKYNFKVIPLNQDPDIFKKIIRTKIDFVFNIAEGIGNFRSRESQIPCMLEFLGLPYFGSDPIALGITLDKFLCNRFLKTQKIEVPLLFMVSDMKMLTPLKVIFKTKKSFIVKPRWEGSSKGITSNAIVYNFRNLERAVRYIFSKYNQPAIIEEFLGGPEITVGVLGNENPEVIAMMEITFKRRRKNKPFIYSLENKRTWQEMIQYHSSRTISENIRKKVASTAIEAFKVLELRDIARIDFRLDNRGNPRIIDVNPLPGLSPYYSDLPIAYRLEGGDYSELIRRILRTALARYGFKF